MGKELSITGDKLEDIIFAMDKIKEMLKQGFNEGIDVYNCNWELWQK